MLEERHRLARELHDSVTQSLYSQMLMAEAAGDMLSLNLQSRLDSCLVDMKKNSLQTLKEMRLLLFELRPPQIGEQNLAEAIRNRLDAVERRAGLSVSLDVGGKINLPAKVQGELFSVVLEALNNSLKHSGAKSVRVMLLSIDHELQLAVEDDGKGFDPKTNISAGMGITSMQERVKKLGGQLEIGSSPGNGTSVTVKLNLAKEQ